MTDRCVSDERECLCSQCELIKWGDEQTERDLNDPDVEWLDRDDLEDIEVLRTFLKRFPPETETGKDIREWLGDEFSDRVEEIDESTFKTDGRDNKL